MTKKRWTTQQLKEILGEPYTIGPVGYSESRGHMDWSTIRVVKIGNNKLNPGEQLGWMQWNCVGGNPREQLQKAFWEVQAASASRSLYPDDVQLIMRNYLGCRASADPDDPNLWVMGAVCPKHCSVLGEGSD
jgi:hypothetical protein